MIIRQIVDYAVVKTTQVEAALRGILDGTLNPDDVKIEGLESEEEKKKKEVSLTKINLLIEVIKSG